MVWLVWLQCSIYAQNAEYAVIVKIKSSFHSFGLSFTISRRLLCKVRGIISATRAIGCIFKVIQFIQPVSIFISFRRGQYKSTGLPIATFVLCLGGAIGPFRLKFQLSFFLIVYSRADFPLAYRAGTSTGINTSW